MILRCNRCQEVVFDKNNFMGFVRYGMSYKVPNLSEPESLSSSIAPNHNEFNCLSCGYVNKLPKTYNYTMTKLYED